MFKFISMMPLFAPTMLLGISLVYIFGNQGVLTKLGLAIPLYGKVGIIIAESVFCFPVAVMILTVAFSAADNRLYEAAEVLGASQLKKMITVTIPNVRYGLISAVFVCFTYSFTDFGAPSVVGGNYNVLATDIYKQVIGQQNFSMGAVVGLIMMAPTVIAFLVDRYVSAKQSGAISSKSIPYAIVPNKVSDNLSLTFCTLISLIIIGYFGMSLFGSLVKFWPYDLSLSTVHYDFRDVAAGSAAFAIKNSIIVSIFTAILGTALAFLGAYIVNKVEGFSAIKKTINFLGVAPMAIPGTVIGLSYILFFNAKVFEIPGTSMGLINPLNFLYGTLGILIIANVIHYYSVPFLTASTALKRLDNEFELVSESLRVSKARTFIRITVPLSVNAILEMAVYYFVNSM
ncbi:MAG: ABC transporter permease subunit, partial [Anaerovoracaceae bacterium]